MDSRVGGHGGEGGGSIGPRIKTGTCSHKMNRRKISAHACFCSFWTSNTIHPSTSSSDEDEQRHWSGGDGCIGKINRKCIHRATNVVPTYMHQIARSSLPWMDGECNLQQRTNQRHHRDWLRKALASHPPRSPNPSNGICQAAVS